MFPAQCDYYRASSVPEALDLLDAHEDSTLIAGGHGVVPAMKLGEASPGALIDIGDVDELRGIETDDRRVSVGALVRHVDLESSAVLRDHVPVLAEAATRVGDRQVRNRGTIGGNLAQAEPAADLPAAVLVADATVTVEGRDGERTVQAGEFFLGDGDTALDEEVITEITMPRGTDRGTYVKKTHPASGYAMVGVAAAVTVGDGIVVDARVAANGVTDPPVRLTDVEEELEGELVDSEGAVVVAAAQASEAIDDERRLGDAYAGSEYRTALLETYTERALETAIGRADGGESR